MGPSEPLSWTEAEPLSEINIVPLVDVLGHYGLLDDLEEKGDQLVGCCPLHRAS